MDDLDAGAQPRCPSCSILMRTEWRADVCPSCGLSIPWACEAIKPTDDPTVLDFPGPR